MYLVPFSVSRHPATLFRGFDRLFDDVFGVAERPAPRVPALDIAETDKDYTVTLDLPGIAKDQVDVTIDGRVVKIEARVQTDEEKKDGDRIVYRERSQSQFSRSFRLPVEIDQDASSAKLDHGVLTLTLAKRAAEATKRIAVN